MKNLALFLVALLASVHYSEGFLCYSQEIGESRSVTFCTNSCYSIGASLLGIGGAKKGCADKDYPEVCEAGGLPGISEHACFCNGFLCNASSMPSVFLPLLFVPYLLLKML